MSLIGKNNHQSVLDEDASIFQVQEQKSEKQKWSELNAKQRLKYFQDYYLLKCLAGILAAVFILSAIWTTLKPRKENMLSIAVIQNYLIPQEKEDLEQQLTDLLITNDNQEITIDDSFPGGYESDAKLSAYLSTQEIDLIITNEEHFKELANRGCFEDLNAFIPDFAQKHAEQLCWSSGYLETDITDETDKNSDVNHVENNIEDIQSKENSDMKAYGIRITNSDAFKNAWSADTEAVAGIVINSLHKENTVIALTKLLFS